MDVCETIIYEKLGNLVKITLNRPDRLNSFNDDMHIALRKALDDAQKDDARAILLTGAGRGFCAGQDLGDRDPSKMGEAPDLGETLKTFYNPLIRRIRSLDIPVICAVNGVAAGAGANIALACDIVIASENAKFIQSFANVGLIPDAGGTWNLTRLVGEARAKGLALTGEPITATQACEWGLIWKTYSEETFANVAVAIASKLAEGPSVGYGLTKQAIHASHANTLDEHLELEAISQKQCGETSDYGEGVSAFLEKRAPNFKGQ